MLPVTQVIIMIPGIGIHTGTDPLYILDLAGVGVVCIGVIPIIIPIILIILTTVIGTVTIMAIGMAIMMAIMVTIIIIRGIITDIDPPEAVQTIRDPTQVRRFLHPFQRFRNQIISFEQHLS